MEMTLSLAVVGIIAGLSLPLFMGMQLKNDLDIAANAVVSSLRRAQTLSVSMDGDSTWGVEISSGTVTIFRGATYASRVTAYDETFAINPNVVITGTNEIVFSKLFGEPSQVSVANLAAGGYMWVVEVNDKGRIEYNPYLVEFNEPIGEGGGGK